MTDAEQIVIVGASLAGATAAEELRTDGWTGGIVLIGSETELPYERPPLSKGVLLGKDQTEVAQLHDQQWYDDNNIDLRLGTDRHRDRHRGATPSHWTTVRRCRTASS